MPGRKEYPNRLWLLPKMTEPLQRARSEGDAQLQEFMDPLSQAWG